MLLLLFTSLAVACSSILDSEDYEIEGIKASTSQVLPLAYGDLGIMDFLNDADSGFIKVYPDGLLYLVYEQDLRSQHIAELFDFPNRNFVNSLALTSGTFGGISSEEDLATLNTTINFNFSPEQLDVMDFQEGIITINTQVLPATPANLNYHVKVELPDVTLANVPFAKNVKGNSSFSLSGYHALFNNNVTPLKLTVVKEAHSNPVVIAPGTTVQVTLSFKDMKYQFIMGFFGDQLVMLPEESLKLTVFQNSLKNTNVSIAEPKASFELYNEYGLPTKVTFAFLEGRKSDGTSLPITIDPGSPLRAIHPTAIGEVATTLSNITNAAALIDFAPDEIYYRLDARINPPDYAAENNFSFSDSELVVKLKVEIPLYGKASDIILSDTMELDLEDVKQSAIESAFLKANIRNDLPFDATLQIYLTDENFQILDSLFTTNQTHIITGSTVTASGDLQSSGVFDEEIEIAQDKIDKLFDARHLILKSRMQTVNDSNGTQANVKVRSTYKMKVNLGLKANLKLNIDL
jgi:hypothetical protein